MDKTKRSPFEQALLDASLQEFSDIPSENEADISISLRFEKKCSRLLGTDKPAAAPRVRKIFRRAVLVAAILSVLTISAFALPAAVRYFVHPGGPGFSFSFDPEMVASTPKWAEEIYRPTYIPKGYSETDSNISLAGGSYIWSDETGRKFITFNQIVISDTSAGVSPNAEGVTTEMLNWGEYEVFCVHDEADIYYWTNHEYFFELLCEGISETEAKKIFSSVQVDENAVITTE